MQSLSRASQQRAVGAWSGASALIEKWLARRCMVESTVNLLGGTIFFVIGLITLAITSCLMAGICFLLMIEGSVILSAFGIPMQLSRSGLFAVLFALFLALTVFHAWRTRWESDSAAGVDLSEAFSTLTTLGLEFFAAGPIFLVLAIQDLHRCVRLSRLDIPQVSGLLLWLFDKGGRAKFAEICMAFPRLNAVRVLPQLRDLPSINWWADNGEITLSDDLIHTLILVLGRNPKNSSPHDGPSHEYYQPRNDRAHRRSNRGSDYERHQAQEPVVSVDQEIVAWYAVLGLPPFTPLRRVKAQYRVLAKKYHPDKQAANRAHGQFSSDEQMKRINEAYDNIVKYSKEHAGAAFTE